ncbi:hypothetical protein ATS75_00025 [Pseudoalteromonas sp. H105]|nr:hypothetical protein ATS75_00025 [Pseudoalteromonas sp. H105]
MFVCFDSVSQNLNYSELRFISVDEPPANYLDSSGELSGFVTEIVKQLQKQLQNDTSIEVMPEARAIRTLDTSPNVIMFSLSRSEERENKYHWLAHVITKRWIFFSRFDSSHEASTLSHIVSSRTVGVIHGDIRERWLQKQNTSNLISILDYNNAVEMLMRDRFDFLFYESFGVFSTLKKLGYSSDMVKSELVARESDVYIVMSKSIDDSALVLEIQNQFSILKKSDWYSNHLNKWVKKLNAEGVADAWTAHGVLKY